MQQFHRTAPTAINAVGDRSQSQKPPQAKQVRFDIKSGLKNMIEESNLELDSIASRSVNISKQAAPLPKPQQVNRSYSQISRSKSPRTKSLDSRSQEKKSLPQFKTRKLALKYKREADENRKKKLGDLSIEERKDTPNFTQIFDQSNLQDKMLEKSPEKIQAAPQPSSARPRIELLQDEYGNFQREIQKRKEVQFQVANKQQLKSQAAGTIVRNQNSVIREQSFLSNKQPGMIIRQRSTSPAVDNLSLGRNKENQSLLMNQSALAGQIVKIQSQKANVTQQVIPSQQILSPKKEVITNTQCQAVFIRNQKEQIQQKRASPLYNTIWDIINDQPLLSKQRLGSDKIRTQIQQQRFEMLKQLTTSYGSASTFISLQAQSHSKLRHLRKNLKIVFQESLFDQVQTIIMLKERKLQRVTDLKKSVKDNLKRNSMTEQLKIELLRDIIARLNQKLVLHTLKLNFDIKREISQQFNAYFQEYIAQDYLKSAFLLMKKHHEKNQEKTQYQGIVQEKLNSVRIQQVFNAWKHIKIYKMQKEEQEHEAGRILLSRKIQRVVTGWKIAIIEQRNRHLANGIVEKWTYKKRCQQLFINWISHHRQQSKIKKKAIMMVSQYSSRKNDQQTTTTLGLEQWKRTSLQQIDEQFFSTIQEILLEREHNKNFVQSLKFKIKIEELNIGFPLKLMSSRDFLRKQDLTMAKEFNERMIYQQYPELRFHKVVEMFHNQTSHIISSESIMQPESLKEQVISPQKAGQVRNSMDLELKYSIHSALVMHQNSQIKQKQINQSSSFISQQKASEQKYQKQEFKKLLPPAPKRLIFLEQSAQKQQQILSAAPNMLFQKIENQLQQTNINKAQGKSFTFDDHSILPLDIQLKEHIHKLQKKINALNNIGYNHHFNTSLKVNATNIVDSEDFNGIRDYIQYGISADQSRMAFIRMFQTKGISILFTQWKARFLQVQLEKALPDMHTINLSRQAFREWNSTIMHRKLKIKEFNRTKQLEKFYNLFKKWALWNKHHIEQERNIISNFKKRTIIKAWLKYMESQGDQLMKILRAQSYYKQALTSKSLLGLYQHYLRQLRIKKFIRIRQYKKYFKVQWIRKYRQNTIMKQIITRVDEKMQLNERLKYQREFEIKSEVITYWKQRVGDKKRLIQHYQALTHYRNQLIATAFINWKKHIRIMQGLKVLEIIPLKFSLNPAFQVLKARTRQLMSSEADFQTYRQRYLKQKIFIEWKSYLMKKKIARMFYQKLIMKHWKSYIAYRNYQLPIQYREQKLIKLFFMTLKEEVRSKWNEQRKDIILRQLQKKKRERIMKIVFLRLLENILIQKRDRIVRSTVRDFREHNLQEKGFRALKRRWLKIAKRRLMNRVAKDFYQKIAKRRELRLRHHYESQGLQYVNQNETTMHRAFTSWRMYIYDKLRRNTVLDRYKIFKMRSMLLKCFLAWHQIAKYEQSIMTSHRSYQLPLAVHSPQYSQGRQGAIKPFSSNRSQYENKFQQVIGSGDITQVLPQPSESPFKIGDQNDRSLFEELDSIFKKNKRWLEEQKEREEFLREMAQHYNQRLSQEMSTLRYSSEKFMTVSSKGKQK